MLIFFVVLLDLPLPKIRQLSCIRPFCFLLGNRAQEINHGSGRSHRSAHEQGALVAAIETFHPVGRINHPTHIFGKPQIGKIGRIAFSVQSGKARVLLAPNVGQKYANSHRPQEVSCRYAPRERAP